MAESTKSVSDVKQSVSEHVQEVQQNFSKATKDLSLLTRDLIQKESTLITSFKEQTAQEVKDVQQSYSQKEEKMLRYFQHSQSNLQKNFATNNNLEIANQYEKILQENVKKLKDIAKDDFKASNANTQELIEDTKNKLQNFIIQTFKSSDSKGNFTETTNTIFASVNKKIRADLVSKSRKAERSRNSLSPDIGQVFVNPMNKPPEEIEAEQLLQQLFEEELLELNELIKKDFNEMNLHITELVEQTKEKLGESIQSVITNELPQVPSLTTESKSLPNLPTASAVKHNISTILNKTGEDFQQVKQNMTSDITRNQQAIHDNVKYYADKLLGKDFLNRHED